LGFQRIFVAGVMTFACLLATIAPAAAQAPAIDIEKLHQNNTTGVPNKLGNRYTLTGKVTSPDSVRSNINSEIAIQDSTGGLVLFEFNGIGPYHFNLGDSISIEAEVSQYNGLTEMVNFSDYVLHNTGNPDANPLVLTCDEVANSLIISLPDSLPEPNEARLIRINDAQIIAGSWPTTCTGTFTILTIQDASGTTTLFIDQDSELCGSPAPLGTFDLIGILSQFDTFAPYNGGYQVVPRYITDIIPTSPGPRFLTNPQAVDVDSISARIIWETEGPATSLVEYGLTSSYGLFEGDSTLVTSHSVPLAGLLPGKLYHYRAASTDVEGTTVTVDFTFVMPSNTPGSMNFYFSKTIDASYANPDTAVGEVDLTTPVVNRINQAQYDISVAIYSFNRVAIADALLAAWGRGVKVRLILDAGAAQAQADRLRAAGVPVIVSTFGGNHADGIHHNKFFVFDTRDVTASTDDWIWTGSFNMTNESVGMANNGVEIQDTGLSQAYLAEFNEEWGSDTDTPNAANSRMGSAKADNTPHDFIINGIDVEQYMSPSDGVDNAIQAAINTAQYNTYFALLVFTSNGIENTLKNKHDNVTGFAIRGVVDQAQAFTTGSAYPQMIGGGLNPWSPPADVFIDGDPYTIHHKYGIIDYGYPASDPQVITGSHNWSAAANTVNDENTLIFHDADISNLYLQEFAERYHNAGGSGDLAPPTVSVADLRLHNGLKLSAPWPNPMRSEGVIDFTLPGWVAGGQQMSLKLYDTRGRLARTLVNGPAEAGPHRIEFDGRDGNGAKLAPGIYFLRLNAIGSHLTQKWVVLE
jgi:phosphatidylserine/phosphatidylglycerophosphate/cardiolipin synthase-like enzyme